jgi:hypothetical protein
MEYVVTQPTDEYMSDHAVESVLLAEYGLLCMADTFKQAFDNFANDQSRQYPVSVVSENISCA